MTEEANKENLRENSSGTGNQLEQKTAEFEKVIADKESEIAALKKSEGELQEKLSAVSKSLTEAVASYKARVIQMNPGITEELISGETIEAVEISLEKAIGLISRVKKSVEKEISQYQGTCRRAGQADFGFIGAVSAGENSIRNRR